VSGLGFITQKRALMPLDAQTLIELGLDQTIPAEVNGRRNGTNNDPAWDQDYRPSPEAFPDASVAMGKVTALADYATSEIYPGTTRKIWFYRPAVNLTGPVRLIIFNDGPFYLSREGPVRATRVLDSLHHNHEIAPTAAIFISPGMPDHDVSAPIASYGPLEAQRSLEYDQVTPRYGEFLFHEMIPLLEANLGLKVDSNPDFRTVCGISSGGIAAFNAAWHHPSECRRVLSHCGSFTDIWGGHNYPSLIRQQPRKPLRAYLQSGENDANTPFGNWAFANHAMASALEFAGYDFHFEFGRGGHSLNHGGALLADSLRWLWQHK